MGCTSAKPKRTTSIEDVASKPHPPNQVPDKNGQVNKAPEKDKLLREKDPSKTTSETKAIEIPGAHKSFMAPDGIPFIDEDVESELDDGTTQPAAPSVANDIQNVKRTVPDQNKNVAIVVNKEEKVAKADAVVTATKSSALRENAPSHDESRTETLTSEPVVISDIKIKEIQITTTKNQETDSSEAKSRRTLTDEKSKTDEELAATKIQAGIRGFLDRQKVKAIRANSQQPAEEEEQHKDGAQQQSGPKVTEHTVVKTELHADDGPQDPKLDAAATKIQANYKGYRTRKEIKIIHSK